MSILASFPTFQFTGAAVLLQTHVDDELAGEEENRDYLRWVIKRFAIYTVLLLAVAFCLSACSGMLPSTNTASDQSAVPGEKVSDEGRLGAGTGAGPNASVKW
jgi:hypothetical protein